VTTLGRFNLSAAAAKHHQKQLAEDLLGVMLSCDSLGINEAGQAKQIVYRAADSAKMRVWFGEGKPGQASTPVAVTERAEHVRFEAWPLTRQGRYVGPGAGPDHSKAKWLMVALFELDGEKYADGNVHLSASQFNPLRMTTALLQVRRANRVMRREYADRHRSLGGDMNNVPGARTFMRLRRWMRSTQRVLGPESTHGRRAIDDVYVDKTLRPIRHEARPTISDHDAYLVTVKPKEHR
jgi:hypothetical protein